MHKHETAGEPGRKNSSLSRLLAALSAKSGATWLMVIGLIGLTIWPRLTALNQYLIVDEADRWHWAEDFVTALSRGNLAGTLVGDGYPGIVPVWAESIWIFIEAIRRSLLEGQWLGQTGLAYLFHEWDRTPFLFQQRLPIVLLNTGLALLIVWAVWRLFGHRVALISGLLIALDPFYLSDSRVNRAEAVIAGLMTLSILMLVFYHRQGRYRYVILSGLLGGLSLLTKIQALAMLPAVALAGLWIYSDKLRGEKREARSEEREARSEEREARSEKREARSEKREADSGKQQAVSSRPAMASHASSSRFASLLPTSYFLLPTSYSLHLIQFGLVWAAAAGLTWFLLWPSMWVTPLKTLALVYDYATHKVGAEGVNLFFLGQTYQDADPGLLFYPVVFFMRLTPLALLGLIGALARAVPGKKRGGQPAGDPFALKGSAILVIYVLFYALAMTLGSHKQDRYLMPIFPGLDILAAMGLVYLWAWVRGWGRGEGRWKVEDGRWKMEGGGWKVEDGRWKMGRILAFSSVEPILLAVLVIVQMATVLPHHPYYYSYFNPLFGGGRTAIQTLRIGWGEGMDQVGAYLAAKPNSQNLLVASRFTHNMLGFEGELISLDPGGRWTQADYIVLYIQQVQRGQEPSSAFIDYFQARRPEKVIRLGDIDYAWIYPIPFANPANPQINEIAGQAALLGYSWEGEEAKKGGGDEAGSGERGARSEAGGGGEVRRRGVEGEEGGAGSGERGGGEAERRGARSGERGGGADASEAGLPVGEAAIRLLWENQGLAGERQLAARLVSPTAETEWVACLPDPAFAGRLQTPGAYLESLCRPAITDLPPGAYTLEFGLVSAQQSAGPAQVAAFRFPEGWQAVWIGGDGRLADAPQLKRFEAIARQAVPPGAQWLDRVYEGRLRLAAYKLKPARPKVGATVELVLYWQPLKELLEPLHLVTQLAESRDLSLGRSDSSLPPTATAAGDGWLPGEVMVTRHKFELPPEFEGPLAARIEVNLQNQVEVFWRPTTLTGQSLDSMIAHFTVAPEKWPTLTGAVAVEAAWLTATKPGPNRFSPDRDNPAAGPVETAGQIALRGYVLPPEPVRPGETLAVTLLWQTDRPVAENYEVFVHLLDEAGQIKAQNDSLPRAGAYPTPWWQPGLLIEDTHPIALPENLAAGMYQLVVGLYQPESGTRLRLTDTDDTLVLTTIQIR